MKERNFKELKKEELKEIKGGDAIDNGDNVIIEYSLSLNPKLLEK